MSTYSEIIIFEKNIPAIDDFIKSAADLGVALQFPGDFDFKKSSDDFVDIEIDGDKTFFAFSISAITESDFMPGKEGVPFESEDEGRENQLPQKARKYGDMIMEFSTKGILAGQAVYFIQKILAKHSGAAGFFDGEFITPRVLAKDEFPTAETPPELAATMIGSPSQRAAALAHYFDIEIEKRNAIDAANGIVRNPTQARSQSRWLWHTKFELAKLFLAFIICLIICLVLIYDKLSTSFPITKLL